MVRRPPAQHFQPEVMNTDSMDLVEGSVKRGVSSARPRKREMTKGTEKIQNGGTEVTETNGDDCWSRRASRG
jgi:hypothetical protein